MSRPRRNAKPSPDREDQEDAQAPLIPMSEDELKQASRELALLIGRLNNAKAAHQEERAAMRADEKKLEAKIDGLATTIRTQGR